MEEVLYGRTGMEAGRDLGAVPARAGAGLCDSEKPQANAGGRGAHRTRHARALRGRRAEGSRSEEHTSELQSLMRTSYAVFCLIKKTQHVHKDFVAGVDHAIGGTTI